MHGRSRLPNTRIGVVSVDQDVEVGIDHVQHVPDDLALSLAGRKDHLGTSSPCDLSAAVRRVVVEDVDARLRQLPREVLHSPFSASSHTLVPEYSTMIPNTGTSSYRCVCREPHRAAACLVSVKQVGYQSRETFPWEERPFEAVRAAGMTALRS